MRLALGATQHGTTKSVTTNDQREGEGGAGPRNTLAARATSLCWRRRSVVIYFTCGHFRQLTT